MKVAVIGGGITGAFATYYLLKKGHDVVLFDYEPIKGVRTSVYNAGSIAAPPSFTSTGVSKVVSAYIGKRGPVYASLEQILRHPVWYSRALRAGANPYNDLITAMSVTSLALYDLFFEAERADVDNVKGGLKLYATAESAEKKVKVLNGRFVSSTEANQIGFKGFGGGVFYENRRVDPHALFTFIRRRVQEMGATFVTEGEAHISAKAGVVEKVEAGSRQIVADAYVLSAGAWSNRLCGPLSYDPRIMPARGLVMLYDTGGKRVFDYAATLEDEGIVLVQHTNLVLRLTGYFELVGFESKYEKEREDWLLSSTRDHMTREASLKLIEKGVGLRPCTPDQLPLVGKIPRSPNAYIATGCCRKGMTIAPLVGSLITSMVSGEETDPELTRKLDPSRYA